ncbi:unnamed protein product [Somion occarium]|uniref:Uncharacterized protein n=1 Tax=Somion occarium TaxID=3059160 RepID=A0ABP1CGQ4_9APHY
MALLGLFHKREKNKSSRSTTPSRSNASDLDPTEAEYVLPSSSATPALPNGLYNSPLAATASSSKLKLGFGRKKSSALVQLDETRLHPPLLSSPSVMSEPDMDQMRPPPAKSALFSVYADSPGAHSTRSLPTNPFHSRTDSRDIAGVHAQNTSEPPNSGKKHPAKSGNKGGGFFHWGRDRSKSRPPAPPLELTVNLPAESFNLKSFRHIGSDAPLAELPRLPSSLSSPFNTPPLRPRVNSVASDTSQRISVAAFREMAARRANSPSPALRPPSTADLSRISTSSPTPGRRSVLDARPSSARASTALALSSDSTSTESESEESSSEDSGGSATLRPKRSRTITQRSASKATSELGHRAQTSTVTPTRTTQSNLGHDEGNSRSQPPSASRPPRAGSIYGRTRASASTSALHPNAAARRASLRAAPKVPIPGSSRPTAAQSTTDSSDSDSDDSDDAPLAQLVGPRRPGSSASSATSGSRPRMPAKPLIDLSGVNPPVLPPLPSFDQRPPSLSDKSPSTTSEKPSLSDRLARVAQTAATKSKEDLSRVSPVERRSLDYLNLPDHGKKEDEKPAKKLLPHPSRSQTAPTDGLEPLPTPGTKPKPNGRSLSSPNAVPVDLTDTKPIVPTPIRERSPPPAFSVTSRPTSQVSMSSNPRLSGSMSPAQSAPTIRAVAPSSSSSPTNRSPVLSSSPSASPSNPPLRSPPPRTSSRVISSTLIPNSGKPPVKGFTGGGLLAGVVSSSDDVSPGAPSGVSRPRNVRQRSSTMVDSASSPSAYTRSSINLNTLIPSPSSGLGPPKPFADNAIRGNSPASSTGDSSSGRTPLTPADGSEVGYGRKSRAWESGESPSLSLTFELPEKDRGRPMGREKVQQESPETGEERRRERRRSEAKAAVEFGNLVNGRGPLPDDEDEDVPLNNMGPRMSMMNPMMSFTPPTPNMAWRPPTMMGGMPGMPGMPPGMMFPGPAPNADPAFLAAHQQAMLVAKQAYQYAVAQQAMAQANEEWERGSTATSAFGGGGGYGGMGMGMNPMGMFPNPYGMPGWTGSMMFPNTAQTMYAGSVAGSDIGGNGGWGSRSVYGGPGDRSSQILRGGNAGFSDSRSEAFGPISSPTQPLRPAPRPRTKTAPSEGPLPAQHARSRPAPPPSSWRSGGGQRGL